MPIEFQSGEIKIDCWKVFYQSPGGKKSNGKLIITNRRLIYDTGFDVGVKGQMPDIMFIKWSTMGYMEIAKSDIKAVVIKKNLFHRQVVLTLDDGSEHIFGSGILTDAGMINAINKDRSL